MKKSTAIKVSNVSKSFGVPHEKRETVKSYFVNPFRRTHKDKFDALKNINFEIKKGEFVGIVGRNGSGKSTLLKLLAGIYVPNEGGVNVQGRVVPFLELGVGFSQELSGRENIFLNGTILGMKKKFLEQKYNEIVAFAELEDFMDLPLKNYSSGMQVRLAFSIAMQADADVYLLDEILAVGDAAFQQKSLEEFKRLKKEGKTIIFVSHSPETITKYSDRVLYLKEGEVADIGDAVEVVDRYLDETRIKHYDNWGTGEIKVRSVTLNGEDLVPYKRKKVEKGNLEIRLNYQTKTKVPYVNCGIAMLRKDGQYIFGINTKLDGIDLIDLEGEGTIKLSIKDLNFLPGDYKFVIAFYGKTEEIIYDLHDGRYLFYLAGETQDDGIVSLDHEWEITKNEKK